MYRRRWTPSEPLYLCFARAARSRAPRAAPRRRRRWPTGRSSWTTTRGTTRTSRPSGARCPPPNSAPGRCTGARRCVPLRAAALRAAARARPPPSLSCGARSLARCMRASGEAATPKPPFTHQQNPSAISNTNQTYKFKTPKTPKTPQNNTLIQRAGRGVRICRLWRRAGVPLGRHKQVSLDGARPPPLAPAFHFFDPRSRRSARCMRLGGALHAPCLPLFLSLRPTSPKPDGHALQNPAPLP